MVFDSYRAACDDILSFSFLLLLIGFCTQSAVARHGSLFRTFLAQTSCTSPAFADAPTELRTQTTWRCRGAPQLCHGEFRVARAAFSFVHFLFVSCPPSLPPPLSAQFRQVQTRLNAAHPSPPPQSHDSDPVAFTFLPPSCARTRACRCVLSVRLFFAVVCVMSSARMRRKGCVLLPLLPHLRHTQTAQVRRLSPKPRLQKKKKNVHDDVQRQSKTRSSADSLHANTRTACL